MWFAGCACHVRAAHSGDHMPEVPASRAHAHGTMSVSRAVALGMECLASSSYRLVQSKLVYGLESLQMTQKQMERFDTFLYRGLIKILKVPSTFIDRTYTNKWLLDKANEVAKKKGAKKSDPLVMS